MVEWEWDLGLDRGARSLLRMLRKRDAGADPQRAARSARLADCQPALTALAGALSAMPLRFVPVTGAGGVRGRELLLPEAMDLAADPRPIASSTCCALRCWATRGGLAPPGDSFPRRAGAARGCGSVCLAREEFPGFACRMESARALALAARPAADGFQGREALRERARRAGLRGETPWDDAAVIAVLREARERGPVAPGEALFGEQLETGALAAVSPIDGAPAARPRNPESEADAARRIRRAGAAGKGRARRHRAEPLRARRNPRQLPRRLATRRRRRSRRPLEAFRRGLEESGSGGPASALLRADVHPTPSAVCRDLRAVRGRHSVRRVELWCARISPRLVHGLPGIGRGDRRKLGRRRTATASSSHRGTAPPARAPSRGAAQSRSSARRRGRRSRRVGGGARRRDRGLWRQPAATSVRNTGAATSRRRVARRLLSTDAWIRGRRMQMARATPSCSAKSPRNSAIGCETRVCVRDAQPVSRLGTAALG